MNESVSEPRSANGCVELHVLGEPRVYRDGQLLELPPSRKARALLGYLALTRRPQRRERLSSLLWDVADDARGALRWTLSRLRSAVDDGGASLFLADRDGVSFDVGRVMVDRFELASLVSGIERATLADLENAAERFRGEVLEGCELPDFFEFTAWLSAEREEARRAQSAVLAALCERLPDAERALPYARARVRLDPLDEPAACTLVRLLLRAGRRVEAEEHVDAVARLGDASGQAPRGLLATLRAELTNRSEPAPPRSTRRRELEDAEPPRSLRTELPFVGRRAELARLLGALRGRNESRPALVVVSGEPGIGKSRLVKEALAELARGGISPSMAAAFEADRSLPFLPWVELLRGVERRAPDAAGPALRSLSTASDSAAGAGREALFLAVANALRDVPFLGFDDAHWLDDASTALLHHTLRALRDRPLVCLLVVRRGELSDNAALDSLLRGARRDGALTEIELGPLGGEEVAELARAAETTIEAERVVRESEGNPLLALELSRWIPEPGQEVPKTLAEVVADRLARLPPPDVEVVTWAGVIGPHCDIELLAAVAQLPPDELLRSLEQLERHAILRAAGAGQYRFGHELFGRAVYLSISEPRRRLMHRRIAEVLSSRGLEATNDVSRHAALGGDSALAAAACRRAAERCLRVFANDEARAFARRGLRHAAVLDEARRTSLEIQLRRLAVTARRPPDLEEEVSAQLALAERALDLGLLDDARTAYRLVSVLRWEAGRFGEAEEVQTHLEGIGRAGDLAERARATGEAGQCLALLERDLPRAEALLLEARALALKASVETYAISSGLALLSRHRGELEEARRGLAEARARARVDGDKLSEFEALGQTIEIALESGDPERAAREVEELRKLGEKLREGSEPAFARALAAVIRYARGHRDAVVDLEAAAAELRAQDATLRLTKVLTFAAEVDAANGLWSSAVTRAEEAARLADALERSSDAVIARCLAARAARNLGRAEESGLVSALGEAASTPAALSWRARRALAAWREEITKPSAAIEESSA